MSETVVLNGCQIGLSERAVKMADRNSCCKKLSDNTVGKGCQKGLSETDIVNGRQNHC